LKNKLDIENKRPHPWIPPPYQKKEATKKENHKIEIISVPNPSKKHNQFYYKLILKWDNLRDFIKCIKSDIMRNSGLVVIFE
jgi:hypothetical protein